MLKSFVPGQRVRIARQLLIEQCGSTHAADILSLPASRLEGVVLEVGLLPGVGLARVQWNDGSVNKVCQGNLDEVGV